MNRAAKIKGLGIGVGVVLAGAVALHQFGDDGDSAGPRDSAARPAAAPRAPTVLPTPSELVAAVLVSTGPLVPAGYSHVGTDCGGIEMWVPTAYSSEVRMVGNRFEMDRPGIPYVLIPSHVRACDVNGDGLLDGRDVQAFVETLENEHR